MQETQEMWVQSWGWEGPLEEGMANHSNVLALEILVGYSPQCCRESDKTAATERRRTHMRICK